MNKIRKYMSMTTNNRKSSIPPTASLFKLYETRLQEYFTRRYTTSIPFIDLLRARQELKTIKSIQQKLIKNQLILRTTDKSGVPHLGYASDYERKAIAYRQKTRAYIELSSNPFNDILYKITRRLHDLGNARKITQAQKENMMPIRKETELAYKYFIPKAHKVKIIFKYQYYVMLLSLLYLGRNTTSTNYQYNSCYYNENFEISR
jgi:hypothetical protein